jgi:hypothetical protein
MSKIKKNAENRALKILYTSVLHEKIATIFGPNVVAISTHNTKVFLTRNDVGDGHVGPLSTK